jgi:hypothetical protein
MEVIAGTPFWHDVMDWCRFHGLEPMRIPAGSDIIRDEARRRILYEEFVWDDDGPLVFDMQPVRAGRVEQGEASPLPFPQEV